MQNKTYTLTGIAKQPEPKTLAQLADELAQKTSGVEVFMPTTTFDPPSQLPKPNVVPK